MQADKYTFPDELLYDKDHNWARVEGKQVTQGLTDLGQKLAGEIVYAEVPRMGREVKMGEPFMSMESGKWVGRVKAIVSGKIVGVNQEIEWESTTINHEPYGAGWLVKIEMSDPTELGKLLKTSDAALGDYIAGERKKYGK